MDYTCWLHVTFLLISISTSFYTMLPGITSLPLIRIPTSCDGAVSQHWRKYMVVLRFASNDRSVLHWRSVLPVIDNAFRPLRRHHCRTTTDIQINTTNPFEKKLGWPNLTFSFGSEYRRNCKLVIEILLQIFCWYSRWFAFKHND